MSRIFDNFDVFISGTTSSLLTSVDVVLLMKIAGVDENSGHCIYSIGLKCLLTCVSLLHFFINIYLYMITES